VRAEELAEHASGVLDTGDIERVHDMRVATRRLRAAMEVFEPCFPRKPFRSALRDVKALADGLGERRDRDVAIAALSGFSGQMPSADRRGVEALIEQLRAEQGEANERLAPLVSADRLAEVSEGLEALIASIGRSSEDEEAE
jgi:CHAD domain-containing protein